MKSRIMRRVLCLVCLTFMFVGLSTTVSAASVDTKKQDKFVSIHTDGAGVEADVVDSVLDIKVSEDEAIRVAVTASNSNSNYSKISASASDEVKVSIKETRQDSGINIQELVELTDEVKADIEKEEAAKKKAEEAERQRKAAIAAKTYSDTTFQGGLVDIAEPDSNYGRRVINIQGADRGVLERLVQGEAGGQGFIGAAMVAQCIKDMYVLGGYKTVEAVRRGCGYAASTRTQPNQDVKDAVAYIFDQGGYAVKHRMLYFYAPNLCTSRFHESQNLIVEYKQHRFFDRWN